MTDPFGTELSPDALGAAIREAVEYVDAEGWGQPAALFALVPTAMLAQSQPELADSLDDGSELTVIAQEQLPVAADSGLGELEHVLATTSWPAAVAGCALVQEIIVLPPEAEDDLDDAFEPLLADDPDAADRAAISLAKEHPDGRVARLAAGALRDGRNLCLLQLQPPPGDDPDAPIELLQHPELAPGLVQALATTLENDPDEF
ncbi:PPA1309 family protein [Williamsia sterculiae]|uniref:Uncharacterized protein n=1 Tax=Williamsia sterculiae TaxID=1344003 RepID=A0A1N7FXR0_9NOCA|nr:PPA1309 family protein [Williamsia sterculiae]SIS05110.1 hypothetical protein SAMN05445060_2391 [Williamsia sterculiae]